MICYAIYFNTKDYPNKYVVRKWITVYGIPVPEENCFVEDNLENARYHVPSNFKNIGNELEEDPVILEVWV